jgi:GAF domain-containing protein
VDTSGDEARRVDGTAELPVTADASLARDDLRASLDGVARLVMGSISLEDALTRVAEFAVGAIPAAEGAGVTLMEAERPDTVVASAPFVKEVDAIQYGLGEGPCISAAAERRPVRSGWLAGDPTWPRFGPRVGRLGVHSVLSLPLLLPDTVVGAINVYAHRRDAFDDWAEELGELYAASAAVAAHHAQILAQARRLIAQLQLGLTNHATIDQAIGILIARTGGTELAAMDTLRSMSAREHRRLSEVARGLVEEAGRRARARHTRG